MHHHDVISLYGWLAFFIYGFLGSLHCVGMCGPLSSLLINSQDQQSHRPLLGYHTARVLSYSVVGLLLGVIGKTIQLALSFHLILVLVGIPLALYGLGFQLPVPKFLISFQNKVLKYITHFSPIIRAILIGTLSPLLPCGFLYIAFASALAAPSPLVAGLWMTSFALGTVPLLATSQLGIHWLFKKIPPHVIPFLLRALAFISVIALIGFSLGH